jgi:hypothetical protein
VLITFKYDTLHENDRLVPVVGGTAVLWIAAAVLMGRWQRLENEPSSDEPLAPQAQKPDEGKSLGCRPWYCSPGPSTPQGTSSTTSDSTSTSAGDAVSHKSPRWRRMPHLSGRI